MFNDAPYYHLNFFANGWRGLVTSMVGRDGPFDVRVVNNYGYIRRHTPITGGKEALEGLSESEMKEALAKIEALPPLRNERSFS